MKVRRSKSATMVLAGLLCLPLSAAAADLTKAMKQAAARLQQELARIAALSGTPSPGPLRKSVFSERELNAWLADLVEADPKNALRELALKLFDDNRIEGKALVDMSGATLPLGFKPKMNIYFAAQVIVCEGKARVEFSKIFLDSQPIPVAVGDMVSAIAAKGGNSKAGSILDAGALPRGLKDLQSRAGQVILYY